MLDSRTVENIKEFIVQTISNMIKARASNIKSGWKIVLNILNAAATTASNVIDDRCLVRCQSALNVVASILQDHFWIAMEHFGEVVRCLVSFGLLHSRTTRQDMLLSLEVRAGAYSEVHFEALKDGGTTRVVGHVLNEHLERMIMLYVFS